MENEILNLILNRLDNIDASLKELHIGQTLIQKEQQEMKKEQQEMKKEQQEMKKEQQEMKKEQQEMKKEQQEMKKELEEVKIEIEKVKKDIKGIHHTNKWLRDDIETIYTLQQEDHKILLKHENILNIHTEKLNLLISLAEENKEEHANFEKRISRLEAIS